MALFQPSSSSSSSTATPRARSLQRQHMHEGGGGGGGMRGGKHSTERSFSFNGRSSAAATATTTIRRPKTEPDLLAAVGTGGRKMPQHHVQMESERRVPTKILVKVDVYRTLGALQVMASTEWSVEDLMAASLNRYFEEGRRPLLPSTDPSDFALHYSQFSLQCLDPKEKLIGLGSRNFFLCPKSTASTANELSPTSSQSSCAEEANRATKITPPRRRFMGFLL